MFAFAGISGGRMMPTTAVRSNARLGVKAAPMVIALVAADMATFRPGAAITMVPGAATPVITTYLLVSPAKVTTSPARTVPVPVISGIDVVPTAKPALVVV